MKYNRTSNQRRRDHGVKARHREPGMRWNRRKDNPFAVPKARHGYT